MAEGGHFALASQQLQARFGVSGLKFRGNFDCAETSVSSQLNSREPEFREKTTAAGKLDHPALLWLERVDCGTWACGISK